MFSFGPYFGLFCVPIVFSLVSASLLLWLGISRITRARSSNRPVDSKTPTPFIEILVPLKGITYQSEKILSSLLTQDYPNYRVLFILEDELDPAFELVENFRSIYPHVGIFFCGKSYHCGQKNFGLAKAISELDPGIEILVFCDSSNSADPGWLSRISEPVRSTKFEVCTTFRSFSPQDINIPGVCQAIYATTVFALLTVTPKPWGGGTVIRRKTLERLQVVNAWSETVVDDLVLGNILTKAKIQAHVSPENFLTTPVKNQTFRGLLAFLDRQILFPKFTNPVIWGFTVIWHISICVSLIMSTCGLFLYSLGYIGPEYAVLGLIFWIGIFALVLALRYLNQPRLAVLKWIYSFPILIMVATFVCFRSIFLKRIDWADKRYYFGRGGLVTKVEDLRTS